MNFREYQTIDAVNASTLKTLAQKSPRHYQHLLTHPVEETDAMRFGTAVHAAILEPSKFAALYIRRPDDCDYRTNAGKAWRDEQQQAGRIILTADEHQRLLDMRASVMDHATARSIIEGATVETTITWTDPETGIQCKGRCDIVNGNILADLKTTRDIRPRPFMFTSYQFGYHFSMAFYFDGLRANGIDVDRALLIAVETAAPHDSPRMNLMANGWSWDGPNTRRHFARWPNVGARTAGRAWFLTRASSSSRSGRCRRTTTKPSKQLARWSNERTHDENR